MITIFQLRYNQGSSRILIVNICSLCSESNNVRVTLRISVYLSTHLTIIPRYSPLVLQHLTTNILYRIVI
jgi:hypothetical protein